MHNLQPIIEGAFDNKEHISPTEVDSDVKGAILETLSLLDQGKLRVAEKKAENWVVNEWVKKAVLLGFRIEQNKPIPGAFTQYFDKVPVKFADSSQEELQASGVRIVPPAVVRKGSYIAPNVVLMLSLIHI